VTFQGHPRSSETATVVQYFKYMYLKYLFKVHGVFLFYISNTIVPLYFVFVFEIHLAVFCILNTNVKIQNTL